MKHIALTCLTLLIGSNALAQSIEINTLGQAQSFDIGVLDSSNGGLDQTLWNGTSAEKATFLIEQLPTHSQNSAAKKLAQAALLSSGVPPISNNSEAIGDFRKARLKAILSQGHMHAAQTIVSREPDLSTDYDLQADMALLSGNYEQACTISDSIVEGRAEPNWAKLRAFCHILRDETAAAELTTELLQNNGHKDDNFFALMRRLLDSSTDARLNDISDDPLIIALMDQSATPWPANRPPYIVTARQALTNSASPEARLIALYSADQALSDQEMDTVLQSLAEAKDDDVDILAGGGSDYDYESAVKAETPSGTGQLYLLAQNGSSNDQSKAMTELLKRADKAGAFDRFVTLMAPHIQSLSVKEQVSSDTDLYVRTAIYRSDIATLQQIHQLLEDKPNLQSRIALATDALAYGFLGGALGTDIETRLEKDGATYLRAERDTFIALALGANLSDKAAESLFTASPEEEVSRPVAKLRVLEQAAKSGARAETALIAADLLANSKLDNSSFYKVIRALNDTGMTSFAGQLAAMDFWASE